ncbi:MAG: folate-binding protein YgfZ [Gammaproteobacteria bacterium]|nr:folate-binding protein YgfZ [Gammaproteobacteria bacterium]
MRPTYYTIIRFSGTDRHSFLQGQLTQDLDELRDAFSLPAALCSAKGRVITTCRLFDLEDSTGMALPASMADAVMRRLAMYKLRADVEMHIGDNDCLIGAFRDAGIETIDPFDIEQWQRQRVAAGHADIVPENSEQYTPHMLNLDLTGAISFTKGCYTGQEVVARTEHLGKVKRRLNRYRLSGGDAKIGDKLYAGERDAGKVVNVAGDEILAVTPVHLHQDVLQLEHGTATPLPLPYEIH